MINTIKEIYAGDEYNYYTPLSMSVEDSYRRVIERFKREGLNEVDFQDCPFYLFVEQNDKKIDLETDYGRYILFGIQASGYIKPVVMTNTAGYYSMRHWLELLGVKLVQATFEASGEMISLYIDLFHKRETKSTRVESETVNE